MLDPLGWSRFTEYIALHLVSLPGPVEGCAGGECPDLEKWIEIPDMEMKMRRNDGDHARQMQRIQIVAVVICVLRTAVEKVFLENIKLDGCSWLSSC